MELHPEIGPQIYLGTNKLLCEDEVDGGEDDDDEDDDCEGGDDDEDDACEGDDDEETKRARA